MLPYQTHQVLHAQTLIVLLSFRRMSMKGPAKALTSSCREYWRPHPLWGSAIGPFLLLVSRVLLKP